MTPTPRRLDPGAVLGAASLIAWSVLVLGGTGLVPLGFCSAATLPRVPLTPTLNLAVALNPPAKLACDWMLMVVAMMAPLLVAPLRHVCQRSFAKRRVRASLLFIAGYLVVWLAAGAALQPLALVLRSGLSPLACLGLAATVMLLWQVTPAKQRCLSRCHRGPPLAAFGLMADRDALLFGLASGAACTAACWALMLLPLLAGQAHILAMALVALFVAAERLERPAPPGWGWHGAGKGLRILLAQVRMQLAPCRSEITSDGAGRISTREL